MDLNPGRAKPAKTVADGLPQVDLLQHTGHLSHLGQKDTDLQTKHCSQILFLFENERVLRFSFVTALLQKVQEEQHANLQSLEKSLCLLMTLD